MGCNNSNLPRQDNIIQENCIKIKTSAQFTQNVRFDYKNAKEVRIKLQKINTALRSQQQFEDMEFQPIYSSLSNKSDNDFKQYVWKRAWEFTNNPCIFDVIEPLDIKQGSLGDCYFLSALSVLAEKPASIEKLFETYQINSQGVYAVWLCIDGEWVQIIIDDYFPCFDDKRGPAFSKAHGDELWVLLMEKAYAKVYGSYHQIESGITSLALRDLTGAPYDTIQHVPGTNDDEVWNYMLKNERDKNLMTAGSQKSKQGIEHENEQGIVSSHAYAILNVKEVNTKIGLQNLIQMRNPWGSKEWQGDWSDHSPLWTKQLKNELNWSDADDGIFWIRIDDYCQQFADTSSTLHYDHYLYSSYKINMTNTSCIAVTMKVTQPTHGYISLTQKCTRYFHKRDNYKYSTMGLIVFQGKYPNIESVEGGKFGQERDVFQEFKFRKAGIYTAIITVDFLQENYNDIVISAYSQNLIEFCSNYQVLKPDEQKSMLDQVILKYNPADTETYQYDGNPITKKTCVFGGYLFMHYQNQSNSTSLNETLQMKIHNMRVIYPHKNGSLINVLVKQNSNQTVIHQVLSDPHGHGGYSYSSHFTFTTATYYTDKELIAKIQIEGDEKKRLEGILTYSMWTECGICLFYKNVTKKLIYEEQLKIIASNIKGVEHDINEPIHIHIGPGEQFFIRMQKIDSKQQCPFKSQYSYHTKDI